MLGYRQNITSVIILFYKNVSYDTFDYNISNHKGSFDTLNPAYYILSIDDFNKNYANSFKSPFQNSIFNDQKFCQKYL